MTGQSIPHVVIEAKNGFFPLGLREVWEYRELLYFLTWRDMKVRYAQTVIGVGWAILQPLITMAVFTVIFSLWAKIPSEGLPYPIFAYAALLPWGYFAKCMERSGVSVVNEANLVRKVYFPRLIIPLAATLAGLLDFGIAFAILLVMMGWYGISLTWGLFAIPVLLVMTLATALAVTLWLSALYVKYRDVGAIIPLLTQVWMFASPVVYPVSLVPEHWRFLYSLNPMVGIIEGFRWALLGKAPPDVIHLTVNCLMVFAILLAGMIYFKKMEGTFSDDI